jgi:hypothetical protein
MRVRSIVVVVLLAAGSAHAQVDLQAKAQADDLFEAGKKLVATGDFKKACEDFEASIQVLPQLGVQLNLADCYEKVGRTASAWAEWRVTAAAFDKAGNGAKADYAKDRATKLEPKLDKLVVTVDAPDGVTVKRDGQLLIPALYGKDIPVDEGDHLVEATAPGMQDFSQTAHVSGEGVRITVEVTKLQPPGKGPKPPPNPNPNLNPNPNPNPPPIGPIGPIDQGNAGHGQRIIGIAVGATGVLALGGTGVLALMAKSKWQNALDNHCPNMKCDATGLKDHSSAVSLADTATITFAIGAACLAGGVVVYLLAPHKHAAPSALIVPSPTGLAVVGAF